MPLQKPGKTAVGSFWGACHASPSVDSHDCQGKTAIGGFLGVLHVSNNTADEDSHVSMAPSLLIPTFVSDKPPLAIFWVLATCSTEPFGHASSLFPCMLRFGRLKQCYAVLEFGKNRHRRFFFNPYSRNFACNPILMYIIHSFIILKIKNHLFLFFLFFKLT